MNRVGVRHAHVVTPAIESCDGVRQHTRVQSEVVDLFHKSSNWADAFDGRQIGRDAITTVPDASLTATLRERLARRAANEDGHLRPRLVVRVGLIERGVVQRGLQQVDVAAPDSEELFTHRQAVAV